MGYRFEQDFPGNTRGDDTLRLHIFANPLKKQNLNPKDINHIDIGGVEAFWNLVAPTDIQDNLSHTWEEYHSFQSRAAQLVSDTMAGFERVIQIKGGLGKGPGNTDPAKNKVDSPIVYTGSQRMEYSFIIPFMRYRNGSYVDVYEPIHNFKKYSCASLGGKIDVIDFPAIFEIKSYPTTFIDLPYAALTNVQTTYNSPFVNGYPQRAECTLTFRDIRPLYREWIKDGGENITVGILL